MSNNLDRISYSSLSNYYKCPMMFKLIHIDKVGIEPKSIFMSFGTSCHFICENQLQKKIEEEEINDLFDGHFLEELKKLPKEQIEDKKFINDLRNQAKNIFPQLVPSLEKYFGEYEVVATEFPLLEPITEFETLLNFKGYVDVIIKTRDNKIHIIDLKTCVYWDARKKADKKILYQLIYYKHFYSKKMNIPLEDIECHFVLLKRTAKKNNIEPFRITSGQKRIENAINYLRKPCQNIERGFFLKNKLHCDQCQFYKSEFCK